MQVFETKIGDKKITCEALGVREGMNFQGRVSAVLADGLKAAVGKDVGEIFKEGVELEGESGEQFGASLIMSLVSSGAKFRDGIDWDAFTDLVIDYCEKCKLVTKDYSEALSVDDLDFIKHEQYQVFAWFLECQLGNFTVLKAVKGYLSQALADLAKADKKPLQE